MNRRDIIKGTLAVLAAATLPTYRHSPFPTGRSG